jgi:hypothetical protein
MTDPLVQHVNEMLCLASKKHQIAIAAINRQPIDIEQIRAAKLELAGAFMLLSDCVELSTDKRLEQSLVSLANQQELLDEGLATLERATTVQSKHSARSSLWLWLSLAVLTTALITAFR